jgi:hypothetical protein
MTESAGPSPARPKYNSSALQQAIDRASPALDSFAEKLNAISADINQLEEYLQKSAIRAQATVSLQDDEVFVGEWVPLIMKARVIHRITEVIAWEPHGDKGNWRIIYRKSRQIGQVEHLLGKPFKPAVYEKTEILNSRPLIEMPVPQRSRGYQMLPLLVSQLGETADFSKYQLPKSR